MQNYYFLFFPLFPLREGPVGWMEKCESHRDVTRRNNARHSHDKSLPECESRKTEIKTLRALRALELFHFFIRSQNTKLQLEPLSILFISRQPVSPRDGLQSGRD